MHDVFRHGRVDFAGELDEPRVLPVLPRLPRQIKRIDGNTVPAQARTGVKRHEPEGLRLGCVDDLPDINAHGGVDDFELVHQRDVHPAKRVLEQLGRLGHATGRHRHEGLDCDRIQFHRPLQAGGRIAPHHLGNRGHHAAGIARVLTLRGEREMKVDARLQRGMLLDNVFQILISRARIGRGLQHDQRTFPQVGRDRLAGLDDVGDVGFTVLVQRRGDADDDGVDLLHAREVGGRHKRAVVHRRLNRLGGDVLNIAAPLVERIDLGPVDIKT